MDTVPANVGASTAARRCLLTVWCGRPGEFSARAVLEDGTLLDFDSPFELVRFLSSPAPVPWPVPGSPSGLR